MSSDQLANIMTERHDTEIAREPYRITTSQYYRMLETRVLNEDDRVELLDGQILIKEPASPSHSGYTSRIANLLRQRLDGLALVREQHPIHLDDYNEPEPDVAVVRPREDDYIHAHPRPEDVLLLVEVGLSSTPDDRRLKAPRYGRAGIPELWLVDLRSGLVEVFREPDLDGYGQIRRHDSSSVLTLASFPDITLPLRSLMLSP